MAGEIYYPSPLQGLGNIFRNAQFALPGPYQTQLTPQQEQFFQQWVAQNHVPMENPQSYDMRGFFQRLQQGQAHTAIDPFDHRLHFDDVSKTPFHDTFSNESMYAKPNAPHWMDNKRLIDETGKLVYDDGSSK